MNNDDMIEELALELFEKSHEPSFSDDAQGLEEARTWARKIATDLIPTREEIAMAIAAYHWDRESGDVEIWHDLTLGEREAVAENYLTWDSADAVLALLKGLEA